MVGSVPVSGVGVGGGILRKKRGMKAGHKSASDLEADDEHDHDSLNQVSIIQISH